MGRKRKDAVKVSLRLSIDKDLLDELNLDGVNKSLLFSKAAREYLEHQSENYGKSNKNMEIKERI